MRIKPLLMSIVVLFFGAMATTLHATTSDTISSQEQVEYLKGIYDIQKEQHDMRKMAMKDRESRTHSREDSEYALMSKIEENTYTDFVKDGWTLFAIIGLVLSIITFIAQKETEKHTKKVSISSQIGALKDLPRHLYRNLVCTIAMMLKYHAKTNRKGKSFKKYPSESNMLKLLTPLEDFFLDVDATDDVIFRHMKEQEKLVRNYNMEIGVASTHFANKHITDESIVGDIDNILFKPMYLTGRIYELLYKLLRVYESRRWWHFVKRKSKKGYNEFILYVLYTFVCEHFKKLKLENLNGTSFEGFDLDCYFDNDSQPILRSYKELMKKMDETYPNILKKENEKWYINLATFKKYIYRQLEKESDPDINKINEKIKRILDASRLEELFPNISPNNELVKKYYSMWHPKGSKNIEVSEMIYCMLKIDAILEMPKIGMISHEAND